MVSISWAPLAVLGLLATIGMAQNTTSEFDTIRDRRRVDMAATPGSFDQVATWLGSIQDDGRWADVDYTSGCAARE